MPVPYCEANAAELRVTPRVVTIFDPALTTMAESIVTVKVLIPCMPSVSVAVTVSIHVPTGVVESVVTMPVVEPMAKPCKVVTAKVLVPVPVEVSDVKAGVWALIPKVVRILPPLETTTAGLTVIVS